MQVILDAEAVERGLRRVAGQIIENSQGLEDVVLIGIRRGGEPIAARLAHWFARLESVQVPRGTVDITLYRDDSATALANPKIGPSSVPGSLKDKVVVLCDDVVHTGRTVRAAIDALMDYGRPRRIELAALVDRGGRELPIQPNYVVLQVSLAPDARVEVSEQEGKLLALLDGEARPLTRSSPP
ncbi:MAG: bifunctional pyr operon transcriptional regulator/uracil phosphoribosyltransferase PyrR [Polyangiaceae bacterium]